MRGRLSAAGAGGAWTTGPELPSPRAEVGAAIVDGQLIVLGGGVGVYQTANEILDLVSDTWRKGAPMPRPLNHHGVIGLNGKVYVFGGADQNGRQTNASLEYDPSTDSWRSLPPLPTPRMAPGVAVLDGQIYVVGGIGAVDTPVTEIFDPASETWSQGPSMTVARDHFVLAAWDGKLYAIGGRIRNFTINIDTVEILDPSTGVWRLGTPMPTGRSGIGGATIDGKVYILAVKIPGRPTAMASSMTRHPMAGAPSIRCRRLATDSAWRSTTARSTSSAAAPRRALGPTRRSTRS